MCVCVCVFEGYPCIDEEKEKEYVLINSPLGVLLRTCSQVVYFHVYAGSEVGTCGNRSKGILLADRFFFSCTTNYTVGL